MPAHASTPSDDALIALERWLGAPLAAELRACLVGRGERAIGPVLLYAGEDLIERNEGYETRRYCPGYLSIGDDGGGRAIVVHAALTPPTVFVVGHGSMSEADFVAVHAGLAAWIEAGCPLD